MDSILSVFVPGIPKPAGSKRPFLIRNKAGLPVMKNGRPLIVVTDASGKKGKDWRADVRAAVQKARGGQPLETGCLFARFSFQVPRPKSHYGSGKNSTALKADAPTYPKVKPDLLKLARGIEDCMTSVVYQDDSQIVQESLSKSYADPQIETLPGVNITLERLEP
jgi:Holliday junction resolvase RusA-like endonuclease